MSIKIKYMVKCPYCGNTFTVAQKPGEDFICPTCGGASGLKDAIKIREEVKPVEEKIIQNKTKPVSEELKAPEWYGKGLPSYSPDTENTKGAAFSLILAIVAVVALMIYWLSQDVSCDHTAAEKYKNAQMLEMGNHTQDAKDIRILVKELLLALEEDNYSVIVSKLVGSDDAPLVTEEQWIAVFMNSELSRCLSIEDVKGKRIKSLLYIEGYPAPPGFSDSEILEKEYDGKEYQSFTLTVETEDSFKLEFMKNTAGEWALYTPDDSLLRNVQIAINCGYISDENGRNNEIVSFKVDGIELTDYYTHEEENKIDGCYFIYTIPYLYATEHTVTVTTTAGVWEEIVDIDEEKRYDIDASYEKIGVK